MSKISASLLVPMLLGGLFAGCLTEDPPGELAFETDEIPVARSLQRFTVVDATRQVSEPALVRLSDGTLLLGAYQGGRNMLSGNPTPLSPLVWRSQDDGSTWKQLTLPTLLQDAWGNSDLSFATGGGQTVLVGSLFFAGATNVVSVGWSKDGGDSWAWRRVDAGAIMDRPWVRVAPDGSFHVVWNNGVSVLHESSADGGSTWSGRRVVASRGGDGAFDVSEQGVLAVRIVPVAGAGFTMWHGNDGVAVSADGGKTWVQRVAPGNRSWPPHLFVPSGEGFQRAWEPLAFDSSGTLAIAWAEPGALMGATSTDHGVTWNATRLTGDAGGQPFYGYLSRGAQPGSLSVSYFTVQGATFAAWVARWTFGASPALEEPILVATGLPSTQGEYFPTLETADGATFASLIAPDSGRLQARFLSVE